MIGQVSVALVFMLIWESVAVGQVESDASLASEAASDSTDQSDTSTEPLTYIAPKTVEMLVGLRFTAPAGNVLGTLATTVFPTSWPEPSGVIVMTSSAILFLSFCFRDLSWFLFVLVGCFQFV